MLEAHPNPSIIVLRAQKKKKKKGSYVVYKINSGLNLSLFCVSGATSINIGLTSLIMTLARMSTEKFGVEKPCGHSFSDILHRVVFFFI